MYTWSNKTDSYSSGSIKSMQQWEFRAPEITYTFITLELSKTLSNREIEEKCHFTQEISDKCMRITSP